MKVDSDLGWVWRKKKDVVVDLYFDFDDGDDEDYFDFGVMQQQQRGRNVFDSGYDLASLWEFVGQI